MLLSNIEVFRTIIYILLVGCEDNTGFNIFFLESFGIELKTKVYSKGIIL